MPSDHAVSASDHYRERGVINTNTAGPPRRVPIIFKGLPKNTADHHLFAEGSGRLLGDDNCRAYPCRPHSPIPAIRGILLHKYVGA